MMTTLIRIVRNEHATSVYEIASYRDIPVLVHEGGRYPQLRDDDGLVTRYIDIAEYDNGWYVTAVAGLRHGQSMQARVGIAPDREQATVLYERAVSLIEALPARYDEADRIYEICGSGISRERYEELARQYDFVAQPDEELSTSGSFGYPQYSLEQLPQLRASQSRAFAVRKQRREQAEREDIERRRHDDDLILQLRQRAPSRQFERFVPLGAPDEHLRDGKLFSVVRRQGRRRITPDDPSIHGSHLLGSEGDMGELVTVEVRE